MRVSEAHRRSTPWLQTASVIVLGALVSGCAGDVMRFSDGFYTNAIPTRPPAAVQTPFPSNTPNVATAPAPVAPTTPRGIDTIATGSINNAAQQINRGPLAPPAVAQQPLPSPATVQSTIRQTATATTQAATGQVGSVVNAAGQRAAGWTATGGTTITLAEGETVYNLSKRYGVPADAIVKVNNLSDARSVRAGQQILIPTYVYGRSVPVSAPDANSAVRSARASVGGRSDVNLASAPTPNTRPTNSIAATRPALVATPTARPQAAATQGGRYTVQSGDTLSAISRRTGASVASIKRTNGLTSDVVRIGQSLIIPGVSGAPAQVAANANVDPMVTSSVTRTPNTKSSTSSSVVSIDQGSTASAPAATGVGSMRWPARGRVISGFGSNSGGRPNDGIDISVPKGTDIKAAENGVVIYAGDGLKEFGNTVLVRHSDGLVTVYGHLDRVKVERGDQVSRGQTIAASGMTGNARQPQLHFEVRKDTKPVDPVTYLN